MKEEELTKGERTGIEIIDAAHHLFVDQGYHGTSMRQIAEAAGIALGGIYNHFAGKEEIFEGVIRMYHPYHDILAALEEAPGDTIEEFVRNATHLWMGTMSSRKDFLNLMFIEIVEFESRHMPALFQEIFPKVVEFTQRMLDKPGNLRPIPTPVILRTFLGLFFAFFITELLFGEVAPPGFREGALDHSIDIFLHGILADEPSRA
jgi:AcrR family transcriptional regulator